jgi:hypothetical protein
MNYCTGCKYYISDADYVEPAATPAEPVCNHKDRNSDMRASSAEDGGCEYKE